VGRTLLEKIIDACWLQDPHLDSGKRVERSSWPRHRSRGSQAGDPGVDCREKRHQGMGMRGWLGSGGGGGGRADDNAVKGVGWIFHLIDSLSVM